MSSAAGSCAGDAEAAAAEGLLQATGGPISDRILIRPVSNREAWDWHDMMLSWHAWPHPGWEQLSSVQSCTPLHKIGSSSRSIYLKRRWYLMQR